MEIDTEITAAIDELTAIRDDGRLSGSDSGLVRIRGRISTLIGDLSYVVGITGTPPATPEARAGIASLQSGIGYLHGAFFEFEKAEVGDAADAALRSSMWGALAYATQGTNLLLAGTQSGGFPLTGEFVGG